jgi:hypothetical protein
MGFVEGYSPHLVAGRVGGVDAQVFLEPGNGQIGILLQVTTRNA